MADTPSLGHTKDTMSILDLLRDSQPENMQERAMAIVMQGEMAQENRELESRLIQVEESLLEVADAFDNIGWSPLTQEEVRELPLKTVKKAAEIARALNSLNPFIKRGIEARIGYIWGDGLEFKNLDPATEKQIKTNKKRVFSQQAYAELERVAATDGNVFRAISRGDDAIIRVPLDEIVGKITNPDNKEEVWYYKRQWTVRRTTLADGSEKKDDKILYYPSIEYAQYLEDTNKALPKRFSNVGVEQKYVMQHIAVNKQVGWTWGVPDIMPVIYYAKAYKEYLEDNASLVKAYSRIAWQIKAQSAGAANATAASMARPPERDPLTGEVRSAGATAVTGTMTEMVAQGTNGSSVDFSKGEPLAAAIASGLEVSLDVIISSSQSSGEASTLDLPTLKAMGTRQKLWEDSFVELFEFWGDDDVEVTWGQIAEDETHRRVQSIQLAREGGDLFREESRAETLKTLKIVPLKEGLPDDPAEVAFERAQQTAEAAAAAQPDSNVPAQGKGGAVGSVNSGKGQVKEATKKSMANQKK